MDLLNFSRQNKNLMQYFVFRNSTVEPFLIHLDAIFSGYDDISETNAQPESYIWFYIIPVKADCKLLVAEIKSYYESLVLVYQRIPKSKSLIIFSLAQVYSNPMQTGDFSILEAVAEFNQKIVRLAAQYSNIKIIDIADFTSRYSNSQLIDWKYYYLSKMMLNPKLAGDFRMWLDRYLVAIHLKRKKCLIVDLDNTLWGGILGEDGVNGIKIGGDYPGSAFYDFQKSIIELYKAGIILAICSKNNESDVLEAWEKNPYILIRKEHLAAYRINWNNKAQNIAELVKQLNIGADSIVFIDDNPTERELVKQFLPMVEVPDFPLQPYLLPLFIKQVTEKYFMIYKLTGEDKIKTRQYQENAVRDEFQKSYSDFSEYLSNLEMRINLQFAKPISIPRIAQMTQKTNQFNLTTKRYTEAEIYSFIEQGHWVYSIEVSDRFGESGISGLIIVTLDKIQKNAYIDSILLSCRILGKGIEEAFVNKMLELLKNIGIIKVTSSYIQTAKNEQVSNFYEKMGFTLSGSDVNDVVSKSYFLDLSDKIFEIKPFYNMTYDGNKTED